MNKKLLTNKYTRSFGALGAVSGIVFSIYKKTGFWKGAGNYILFGLCGSLLGTSIYYMTKKNKNE